MPSLAASKPKSGGVNKTWNGSASQADLMLTDQVITVDEADNPTGGASKAAAHRFVPGTPAAAGRLHRAFSVFLFDSGGRLLLQRRADSKITFPGVWTNTCCSHQLHGQDPPEVDEVAEVARGNAPGAAHAAVRKLEHELGIPRGSLPPASFKFLTRLHYCAADPASGDRGKEHEVDYVLLARVPVPGEDFPLAPNPEEVSDTAWVDAERLQLMMDPASGLAWSPWFRIIAREWLAPVWWKDLEGALGGGDKYVDAGTVHRVEC